MIISKQSIRARAQQAAAADAHRLDAHPGIVYPDNLDAQAVYEDAYWSALAAAKLARVAEEA